MNKHSVIKNLVIVLQGFVVIGLMYFFATSKYRSWQYQQAFEEVRNMHETYMRTHGTSVNPAYICRPKN